jgi:phosphoserine phosphatase
LAFPKDSGLVLAIISGGIDRFLEKSFENVNANTKEYFHFIFINRIIFRNDIARTIHDVETTEFDYEGKLDALKLVCKRLGCSTSEAVFVGDGHNDMPVASEIIKIIAYPPRDQRIESRRWRKQASERLRRTTSTKLQTEFSAPARENPRCDKAHCGPEGLPIWLSESRVRS